jgi:hypothetical protein
VTDTEKAIAWFENQNKHYDDKEAYQEDYRMNVIALAALHTVQERAENKALTLDELKKLNNEPVYIVEITGREEWNFRRDGGLSDWYGSWMADEDINYDRYGTLWFAYRSKPQEAI